MTPCIHFKTFPRLAFWAGIFAFYRKVGDKIHPWSGYFIPLGLMRQNATPRFHQSWAIEGFQPSRKTQWIILDLLQKENMRELFLEGRRVLIIASGTLSSEVSACFEHLFFWETKRHRSVWLGLLYLKTHYRNLEPKKEYNFGKRFEGLLYLIPYLCVCVLLFEEANRWLWTEWRFFKLTHLSSCTELWTK